jgi:hypothetical protein
MEDAAADAVRRRDAVWRTATAVIARTHRCLRFIVQASTMLAAWSRLMLRWGCRETDGPVQSGHPYFEQVRILRVQVVEV